MSVPHQATKSKSEVIWFCAMMIAFGFFAVVPMRAPQPKAGPVTATRQTSSPSDSNAAATAGQFAASVAAID
ncbi:MAG: hypothetical protein NTV94_03190 [Planctomycetota bacterium]|nr:hypothetical protein [Planctomycetota bacterium]